MATSIDTLPLEMLCHIFSFLGSDILLVCWNISRPWRLVITQRSCWQKEGVWLQISDLEISHADTLSAENYLKKVLHVNSEKLRTIRITQVKADLLLNCACTLPENCACTLPDRTHDFELPDQAYFLDLNHSNLR